MGRYNGATDRIRTDTVQILSLLSPANWTTVAKLVPLVRFELTLLTESDFESLVATITPQRHEIGAPIQIRTEKPVRYELTALPLSYWSVIILFIYYISLS